MRNKKSVLMTLNHNYVCFSGVGGIAGNGLRICEVRQTINLNIYKPLHGVSCIYAVSTSLNFYGLHRIS
jgi:hypothetical protein